MTEKRDKIGKIATDLLAKANNTHSVGEQTKENLSEYMSYLYECLHRHQKRWPNKDFYISVITKTEPLFPNILRNYFVAFLAAPTPRYDEAVYKYHHTDGRLDLIWVVPSKDTCQFIMENYMFLPEKQRFLIESVLAFEHGNLLKYAKKLNGEKEDAIIFLGN